ncbi:hypothetical protein [Spirillospora sp. NPDC029432]|uniref:hypothetical protein n=1 Tax=Spirillospora sp. NPDC029432 TaxID=3154599 RepID=UPI0034539C39
MSDELDRTLRGTLATVAGDAPPPVADLLERVETGHRRRRRRRRLAAALSIAVVLGGTGTVGVAARSGEGAAPVAAKPSGLAPVPLSGLGEPVQIRKKWPGAVRSLPARLPNGREYRPATMLGPDSMLVSTWSSFERTDALWEYDFRDRRVRRVADVVVPPGAKIFPSDFTVAGGQVVWWLVTRAAGAETVQFWAAPLAGGKSRRIAAMPLAGGRPADMIVDGGDVVWTLGGGRSAAIYRVPLSGGAPRKIPGTDGLRILSWPWAGAPGDERSARVGDVRFKSIRNLQTGERRTANVASFKGVWDCSVNWCVGGPASDVVYKSDELATPVQRRNGRDGRSLPVDAGMHGGVLYERFVRYQPRELRTRNHVLYDLETGTLLDTGIRRGSSGIAPSDRRDGRNPWLLQGNESGTFLIDLSKIR